MADTSGRVVSTAGPNTGAHGLHYALIEVDTSNVCERCASGKGCGAGLLGGGTQMKRIEAAIAAGIDVSNGDTVRISLQPRNVLRAAVIVYGFPLSGALAGAIVSYAASFGDVAAAISALSGLALGWLLARIQLKDVRCLTEFTPIIVERLTAIPTTR